MSRRQLLATMVAAEKDHELKRQRLHDAWLPWHYRLRKHQASMVVGGGFLAGVVVAGSPGGLLLRAMNAVVGAASVILRTPLVNLVVAGISTARSARAGT